MSRVRRLPAFVLAGLLCCSAQPRGRTSPGSDWKMGDLFVSVAPVPESKSSFMNGEYRVFGPDGVPSGETVGVVARNFTAGCAVEVSTGYLWISTAHGNTSPGWTICTMAPATTKPS